MADFPAATAGISGLSATVIGGQIPIELQNGNRSVYLTGRRRWQMDFDVVVKAGANEETARSDIENWIAQFWGLQGTNAINLTATADWPRIPANRILRPITKSQVSGITRYTAKDESLTDNNNFQFYYPHNGEHFNVLIDGKRRLFRVVNAVGAQFSVMPDTGAIPATDSGSANILGADAIFDCMLDDGTFKFDYDPQFIGPWQVSVIEA